MQRTSGGMSGTGGVIPRSAAGRRVFIAWIAAIALLVLVVGVAAIGLGGRKKPQTTAALPAIIPANAVPTAAPTIAVVPPGDLPYQFPVDNSLIAQKYAEAQGHLPAEARETAGLHRFAAECSDPRGAGKCLLVYVFYDRKTDKMYNYHFTAENGTMIGDFTEPAVNDDYRITVKALPWENNPEWARLLRDSAAQLPADFAPGGFTVSLVANPASLNAGTVDWTAVYFDPASKGQTLFDFLGTTITNVTH